MPIAPPAPATSTCLPLSAHRATLPARTSPEPLWPHAIHDARRLCTHKTFCALPAAPQESADRAPRASESVAWPGIKVLKHRPAAAAASKRCICAFCAPQADSIPPNRSLWYSLITERAEDLSPVMRSERTHLSPFTKDGRDSITIRAFTLFCDTTRVYSNTLLIPW